MTAQRKSWSRDELLVAFNIYCRTPFGRLHRGNPDIIALAKKLGRTPSAVAMKLCNIASLDEVHRARKVAGLRNASSTDRAIFREFEADWEAMAVESEAAMQRLHLCPPATEVEESIEQLNLRAGNTETVRSIRTRRVQSLFRATVLASYDYTCAFSGIKVPSLLQASHIIPWASQEQRRVDPRNGISLSALHDRAFDRGLLAIDKKLRIIVSGKLRIGGPSPIHRLALLDLHSRKIRLPTRYAPDPLALEWHRDNVFVA